MRARPAETAEGEETGLARDESRNTGRECTAERGAEGGGGSAVQELGADKAGQGETVRGRDTCICIRTDAPPKASRNETSTKSVFLGRNAPESVARPIVSSSRPDSMPQRAERGKGRLHEREHDREGHEKGRDIERDRRRMTHGRAECDGERSAVGRFGRYRYRLSVLRSTGTKIRSTGGDGLYAVEQRAGFSPNRTA